MRSWQPAAVCLLCAFILVALVDQLPDPPAVGPHGNEAKASCLNDHREGRLDQDRRWVRTLSPALVVVRWIDSGKVFEAVYPVPCPTLMRQAADSSPPASAC